MNAHGFELLDQRRIATLNLDFQAFRHVATGARHYHLACDDDDNAFMVAFPTLPQDSTGVAHILEHTTLCGSERYPVRDPFFMMLRRSLNTFMNAFTSSDSTAYPFATRNRKDFDNLLAVYLDAVFFPAWMSAISRRKAAASSSSIRHSRRRASCTRGSCTTR